MSCGWEIALHPIWSAPKIKISGRSQDCEYVQSMSFVVNNIDETASHLSTVKVKIFLQDA